MGFFVGWLRVVTQKVCFGGVSHTLKSILATGLQLRMDVAEFPPPLTTDLQSAGGEFWLSDLNISQKPFSIFSIQEWVSQSEISYHHPAKDGEGFLWNIQIKNIRLIQLFKNILEI